MYPQRIFDLPLLGVDREICLSRQLIACRIGLWSALLSFEPFRQTMLDEISDMLVIERSELSGQAKSARYLAGRDYLGVARVWTRAFDAGWWPRQCYTDEYVRLEYVGRIRESMSRLDDVRKVFVESNLRLVLNLARRFTSLLNIPFEDAVQDGNCGLMKAVDRFDPERGVRFSTYAMWWIRAEITRQFQNTGRLVRIPVHAASKFARFRMSSGESLEDLARTTGLPEKSIQAFLSAPVHYHSIEDYEEELYDHISEGATEVDIDDVIHRCLEQLSPFEAETVRIRFGIRRPSETAPVPGQVIPFKDVGAEMDVSTERARKICLEATKKLRDALEASGVRS